MVEMKETKTGLYDETKVVSVSMGVTINLLNYENIRVDVVSTDAETCRRALIEALYSLPLNSAPHKEAVQKYLNNVLVRKP